MPTNRYLDISEAACKYGMPEKAILYWIRRGILKAKDKVILVRVKKTFVDTATIERFYAGRCEFCGKKFRIKHHGRRSLYCRTLCRKRAYNRKKKAQASRPYTK